mmetsp:Transcript_19756/g.58600  ORF Transcript_19756/g.58600 Transcript_19756/m.58600 type:complete len:341 (-) Transcript_19756:258-1280(-)
MTKATRSSMNSNTSFINRTARLTWCFCPSRSTVHIWSSSEIMPKPRPSTLSRSCSLDTRLLRNFSRAASSTMLNLKPLYLSRRPRSKSQMPIAPCPCLGDETDLRASHVSSPSVSRMFSSTSTFENLRPFITLCIVCKQRLSGDTTACTGCPLVSLGHQPPLASMLLSASPSAMPFSVSSASKSEYESVPLSYTHLLSQLNHSSGPSSSPSQLEMACPWRTSSSSLAPGRCSSKVWISFQSFSAPNEKCWPGPGSCLDARSWMNSPFGVRNCIFLGGLRPPTVPTELATASLTPPAPAQGLSEAAVSTRSPSPGRASSMWPATAAGAMLAPMSAATMRLS